MRKVEKQAKKAKKAKTSGKGGKALSKEELRRISEDPDSIVWSSGSIALNCLVRSNSATAWFLRDVYRAYYRTAHNGEALRRASDEGGRNVRPILKQAFEESIFAFCGDRKLPELADAVRRTVLEVFGVQGRPGIAIGAVYGWLAEHLPADEAALYRDVDWEKLAGQVAEKAMAKADPAFVDAYRRLRELTSRYPQMPDVLRAYTDATNEQCGLPAFVPEPKAMRVAFLNEELVACRQLLESLMKLRPAFADMLHQIAGEAVSTLVMAFGLRDDIAKGDFFLWFHKEAEMDALLMLKEFKERFEASGKSFDVFYAYWNRVGLMLRDYAASKVELSDFYGRRLKQVCDAIEGQRVVPEGSW